MTFAVIDLASAVSFINQCRNFDGGFGAVPGAESHAGQIFCCVGALSIAGALEGESGKCKKVHFSFHQVIY